jgi:stage II sporulation protein D
MKRTHLIIISLFVVLVIVIPSLIVLPFSGHVDPGTTKVLAKGKNKQAEAPKDPPIAVPVMRHNSKKVDEVKLRDYLIGVVAGEMPAEFQPEALKAQALAARTYIAKFMIHSGDSASPVSDTTMDQVFRSKEQLKADWGADYDKKLKKIESAVDDTAGEVITYNGELISPSFFSTSNGYTEDSDAYWENAYPYLKSVKCPWDVGTPKYKRTETFSVASVEKALGVNIPDKNGTIGTILSLTPGKRVEKFKIGGSVFTGREVREKLDLRSADFAMLRKGDEILITTKGYGHGVGMSQYGANGMAEEGKSYKDIVKYFYQGVTISKLSDFSDLLAKK